MADLLETIAGIYAPLLGLLAFMLLWPIGLLGRGICYLGIAIIKGAERAHDYFERWVSF